MLNQTIQWRSRETDCSVIVDDLSVNGVSVIPNYSLPEQTTNLNEEFERILDQGGEGISHDDLSCGRAGANPNSLKDLNSPQQQHNFTPMNLMQLLPASIKPLLILTPKFSL